MSKLELYFYDDAGRTAVLAGSDGQYTLEVTRRSESNTGATSSDSIAPKIGQPTQHWRIEVLFQPTNETGLPVGTPIVILNELADVDIQPGREFAFVALPNGMQPDVIAHCHVRVSTVQIDDTIYPDLAAGH